ncbi:hypothetical protein [Metapseudomonas sp. CR1201]
MEKSRAIVELERYLSLINFLRDEVNLYEELFCVDSNVSKINETLPNVFLVIQVSMFSSILTRISACLEAEGSDRFGFNISIARLFSNFSAHISEGQRSELHSINEEYERLGIKLFRHKVIAHNDVETAHNVEKFAHSITPGSLPPLVGRIFNLALSVFEGLPEFQYLEIKSPPAQIYPEADGTALVNHLRRSMNMAK